MVVVIEPSVKRGGALGARAVDRAVGPATQEGADEAFGFAVGLGSVGAGAEVADPEGAAGGSVDRGAVGAAVIGQDPLDGDAVAGVEGDSTSEKADDGASALIGQDFGVGQAGAVIDSDVHALPACGLAPDAKGVLASWPQAPGGRSGEPGAGAAVDPSQPLDVDVDQLTRPLALVADRWLKAEASELAHSDPVQDPRDGRERHVEHLGDLRASAPQPSERRDRLDSLLTASVRDPMRRRGAIPQPALPLGSVATHPFARAADAASGGLGRLRQRPLPINDGTAELATAFQTERSVSVQVHPVSSLVGLRWLGSSQPPRRPGWTNLLRNYT